MAMLALVKPLDGALDPTKFGDSVKRTERDITISHPGFKIQTRPLHVA